MNLKRSKSEHNFMIPAVVAMVCFAFVTVLEVFGIFDYPECKVYDVAARKSAVDTSFCDDIVYVPIDQESLDRMLLERGWSWPWPREAYASMIDYISSGNPKAIVFDILFTEPSLYGPDDDMALALAQEKAGNVVQVVHFNKGKYLYPVSPVRETSAICGNITSKSDADGIIRKARIFYENPDGTITPSLAFAPLLLEGSDRDSLLDTIGQDIPFADSDSAYLKFKGNSQESGVPYAHYSAWDILDNASRWKQSLDSSIDDKTSSLYLHPETFSDSYVFVMLYAPGLFDICPTPVSKNYPGAFVHMTALDNYLTDSFVRPVSRIFSIIEALVFTLLGAFSISMINRRYHRSNVFFVFGLFIAVTGGINLFYYCMLDKFNCKAEYFYPLSGFVTSFFSSILVMYSIEGKQKRFIKTAFSQYLSRDVINSLLEHPEKLKLGGEKRNISIFFSDIEKFSTISEGMTAEELTNLLNRYLTEMTDIILKSGGTIDKYEGDAIIAFWNAPNDTANHEKLAVETAVQCQERLAELADEFTIMCGRPLWTRIGLNSGDAVVGNMGSSKKFDYTMYGDSVNLASRLEGINKQFGTYTLVSKDIKDKAVSEGTTLHFREVATVTVVGKKNAVRVYEPVSQSEYQQNIDKYSVYEEALELFYQLETDKALDLFESIMDTDAAARAYVRHYRGEDAIVNTDGIYHAKDK